jgi:hypothetical protein
VTSRPAWHAKAMPFSRRAKLAMAAENLLSFATLAVIVARAVNIARG